MLYSKSKSFILTILVSCLVLFIFLVINAVSMTLLEIDDGMGIGFTISRSLKFCIIAGLLHGVLSAAFIYFCRPVKLYGFCLIALFVTVLLLGFMEFIINTELFHQFLYDKTIRLSYKTLQLRLESFLFNFVFLLIPSLVVTIINKSMSDRDKNKISLP